jgi:hypothetical protein
VQTGEDADLHVSIEDDASLHVSMDEEADLHVSAGADASLHVSTEEEADFASTMQRALNIAMKLASINVLYIYPPMSLKMPFTYGIVFF